jgi:hypothetical protein
LPLVSPEVRRLHFFPPGPGWLPWSHFPVVFLWLTSSRPQVLDCAQKRELKQQLNHGWDGPTSPITCQPDRETREPQGCP